jgi:hypothetical protein
VIDDYQRVAADYGDWHSLNGDARADEVHRWGPPFIATVEIARNDWPGQRLD